MHKPRRTVQAWRSGLESTTAEDLTHRGVPFAYEEVKLSYTKPETKHKYTPDFELENGIIVETKGRFETADRQKHLLIKNQHPELDIRFIFTRSASPIRKGSKTTYASWCQKNGFQFADAPSHAQRRLGITQIIPQAWIDEPVCKTRLDAIKRAST